ncbi:MAG: ATP-binding protein [Clostridia bacterium]|nr:ATP-binding protein [Clostridia bacterium]
MKRALITTMALTAGASFMAALLALLLTEGMDAWARVAISAAAAALSCCAAAWGASKVTSGFLRSLLVLTDDEAERGELRQRYPELERVRRKLDEQKDRILAQEHIKQEFTANVSHELKTPLTSISGYAEMIATGMAKPEDVPGFAARIHKEAQRLLTLISDIIKLSELDETDNAELMEPVELASIVNECADILYNAAAQSGVKITVAGDERSMVMGNESLLTELVFNLMDNAIRYNRRGGRVLVELRGSTLSVSDDGIGIPQQHLERVFERFYRVDRSRSKETGGTGLGLAIVKHVAERHGARIELRSEEGRGTAVSITFEGATEDAE